MMRDSIILIFGKRGSGKSFLAKSYIEKHSRVIIFDPLSEYHSTFVVHSFDELCEHIKDSQESFKISCRFIFDDIEDEWREYQYAARLVYEIGNILLVLEECELFLNSSEKYQSSNFINKLISVGRHKNIHILAIGRRPSEVPIRLRAVYTTIAIFQTDEPRDVAYLDSWGLPVATIQSLEKFTPYIHGENVFAK